jgi:peptidylprolyl isomerase
MMRSMIFPALAICLACGASAQDSQPASAPESAPASPEQTTEQLAEPAVVVTESGLQYIDLETGGGSPAAIGDTVVVHYTGTLENGTQFDSSVGGDPFPVTLGQGRVIAGWEEGLQGMRPGGKRQLTIPPELGYGPRGFPGLIPPNSVLIFEVEMLEIR